MQVFVRGPGNSTVVLNVEPGETVMDLKRLLWARTRIPVERQWLECGGRILRNEAALAESGIIEEATVWCHLRIGGSCSLCNQNRRM